MACTNKIPENLVKDLNTLSLFGKCQLEDIIFSDDEKREREKIFLENQIKREEQLKRQERLKREQEIEDYQLALEEDRRLNKRKRNGINYYTHPNSRGRGYLLNGAAKEDPNSRGRGYLLNGAAKEVGRDVKGRGRGRLSPLEKKSLPLFDRELKVQKNLNQFSDSNFHNNQYQKKYWTELGASKNQEEQFYDPYPPENYTSHTPETSSTSDQFEDALSSSQSNSPLSFISLPSRSSGSPAWPSPDLPAVQPRTSQEVLPSAPLPRKPRGNRLAARFTNKLEEDGVKEETPYNIEPIYTPEEVTVDEEIEKEEDDFLAVLGSSHAPLAPSRFRKGRRGTGMSFNNLHPSQRVLSNDVLLYANNAGARNDFTLNMKDFPTL